MDCITAYTAVLGALVPNSFSAAYQSTVQAAALPQGFGACRTVFIPVLRGQRPRPADPFARISAPVDSL